MINLRIIDHEHKADINIKNEPFKLFGRMLPSYINEKWSFEIERFPEAEITEMCFPDENYDYDELALDCGYRGLYTQGQDNNLAACLFYIKNGFVIGGLDTEIYTGTSQEGKKDILFYYNAVTGARIT